MVTSPTRAGRLPSLFCSPRRIESKAVRKGDLAAFQEIEDKSLIVFRDKLSGASFEGISRSLQIYGIETANLSRSIVLGFHGIES